MMWFKIIKDKTVIKSWFKFRSMDTCKGKIYIILRYRIALLSMQVMYAYQAIFLFKFLFFIIVKVNNLGKYPPLKLPICSHTSPQNI